MGWPQWVVLLLCVVGFGLNMMNWSRSREYTSGRVVVLMFVHIAITAAYAGVLHAGGFW